MKYVKFNQDEKNVAFQMLLTHDIVLPPELRIEDLDDLIKQSKASSPFTKKDVKQIHRLFTTDNPEAFPDPKAKKDRSKKSKDPDTLEYNDDE